MLHDHAWRMAVGGDHTDEAPASSFVSQPQISRSHSLSPTQFQRLQWDGLKWRDLARIQRTPASPSLFPRWWLTGTTHLHPLHLLLFFRCAFNIWRQLMEAGAERRTQHWPLFFSRSGSAGDQSIVHRWRLPDDESDCTGLCLLFTFLVITVFVIIVIVIFLFFTNYNSAYCLSVKLWNFRSFGGNHLRNPVKIRWKGIFSKPFLVRKETHFSFSSSFVPLNPRTLAGAFSVVSWFRSSAREV